MRLCLPEGRGPRKERAIPGKGVEDRRAGGKAAGRQGEENRSFKKMNQNGLSDRNLGKVDCQRLLFFLPFWYMYR